MAVEIGTASNARDLVSKLEKFLTTNPELVKANQAWEVIKDSDGGDELVYLPTYPKEADDGSLGWTMRRRFVGHGLDGEDIIVVPMALYINTQHSITSLCAIHAVTSNKNIDFTEYFNGASNSYRNEPFLVSIPLINEAMPYWFVANGRRFIIVSKVGDYYMSMYCGFMLQFGTDLENPSPMYLGGSCNDHRAINPLSIAQLPSDYEKTFYISPYGGFHEPAITHSVKGAFNNESSSCVCNAPDGEVITFHNGGLFRRFRPKKNPLRTGVLFPYRYVTGKTNGYSNNGQDSVENIVDEGLSPYGVTVNGSYVLLPIELFAEGGGNRGRGATLGWLQGAYFVSKENNTPEKELNIDGKRYLCFPSMQNTNRSWFALLME